MNLQSNQSHHQPSTGVQPPSAQAAHPSIILAAGAPIPIPDLPPASVPPSLSGSAPVDTSSISRQAVSQAERLASAIPATIQSIERAAESAKSELLHRYSESENVSRASTRSAIASTAHQAEARVREIVAGAAAEISALESELRETQASKRKEVSERIASIEQSKQEHEERLAQMVKERVMPSGTMQEIHQFAENAGDKLQAEAKPSLFERVVDTVKGAISGAPSEGGKIEQREQRTTAKSSSGMQVEPKEI
jgi:hypothetical protein